MPKWVVILAAVAIVLLMVGFVWALHLQKRRQAKNYERGLKMMPMLIHLPPSTDDIQGGGRDERDVDRKSVV